MWLWRAYPELPLTSGAIDIGDLRHDKGRDIVIAPSVFTAHSVGRGWQSESVSDALRLRGESVHMEDDSRTRVGGESETRGVFLPPAEVRAGLLR